MNTPRRSFYILLPVLAVLFALGLAELALKLFYPIPFSIEMNMYFEPDPYTGYRHRPSTEGVYPTGVAAIANSRGQRDDEVQVPKPPGVFRILMIGDSFTVGANVEQSTAYPQVLETLLNDGSGDQRIEVVNAGVGGWSPFQYAQYLEHYGEQFEPDLVLVGFFVGNDTYIDSFRVEDTLTALMGRRVSREVGETRWGSVKVFMYLHSNIARLLMSNGLEPIKFRRGRCDQFDDFFLAIQRDRLRNHFIDVSATELKLLEGNVEQLARMKRWSTEHGASFAAFIFPDENQVNVSLQQTLVAAAERPAYDFDLPQSRLAPLLDDGEIIWASLLESFRSDSRCLYMGDTHWTSEGHYLVAEYMRDFLQQHKLLAPATSPLPQ